MHINKIFIFDRFFVMQQKYCNLSDYATWIQNSSHFEHVCFLLKGIHQGKTSCVREFTKCGWGTDLDY